MRTRFELADIVNLFGEGLIEGGGLTPLQLKVLANIRQCRTAALGGHEEACQSCGSVRYSYNSCGDRHCPKCHASKQAFWIDDLMQNCLPIKHYHIVFTLPHHLNAQYACITKGCITSYFLPRSGTLYGLSDTHIMELKAELWLYCTHGAKT